MSTKSRQCGNTARYPQHTITKGVIMNQANYINIRHSVYDAICITPDKAGAWLVTDVRCDRIVAAAQGDFRAITATLDRMTRDGELADILPALVDWSHEAARTAA